MSVRRRFGALIVGVVLGLGGAAVAAVPAQAAPPDVWGFAFNDNPTPLPGTVMDPTRQWGSWKAAFPGDFATVDHLGPGHYMVRFPHLATKGGVAHVTAVVGQVPAWCQLDRWFYRLRDLLVLVRCHRHGGAPFDTQFSVSFDARSAPLAVPGGGYAHLHADAAANILYEYNSAGLPNATGAGGGGFYKVFLPGVGDPTQFAGNIQVSAVDRRGIRYCKVVDAAWGGADVYAYVRCFDEFSNPADSAFTLTYHRERPVYGELDPPKRFAYVLTSMPAPAGTDFNSTGAVNSVFPSGPGMTFVVFPQVGVRETHLQVTAFSGGANWCVLQFVWILSGGDALQRNVICFDGTGAQADTASFVTFSSRI